MRKPLEEVAWGIRVIGGEMGNLRDRPLSKAGVVTQLPTAKSDHEVVRTYGMDISIQLAGFQALSHE